MVHAPGPGPGLGKGRGAGPAAGSLVLRMTSGETRLAGAWQGLVAQGLEGRPRKPECGCQVQQEVSGNG